MNIQNFIGKKWSQFKQHTAEVAEIQKQESAKRDQEMEELVAHQDTYRAERREQRMEAGRQLQQEMKVHYADLDKRNAAKREKLGKMMDSIKDFFSKKWF